MLDDDLGTIDAVLLGLRYAFMTFRLCRIATRGGSYVRRNDAKQERVTMSEHRFRASTPVSCVWGCRHARVPGGEGGVILFHCQCVCSS